MLGTSIAAGWERSEPVHCSVCDVLYLLLPRSGADFSYTVSQVFWRAALPPARGSTPVDVWQNACAEHVGKVRNALIDVGESDHLVQAFELLSIWVHR